MSIIYNPKIDNYLAEGCGRCALGGTPQCKVHNWPNELVYLRNLVLDCHLVEELKWSVPCYTFNGQNILILSAFKEYCAISFFKGSLLQDEQKLLKAPGENSQAARLFRFTSLADIKKIEPQIRAYIFESIEIEKAGLKVESRKVTDMEVPAELLEYMDKDPAFNQAFSALTPGRKKGYYYYIAQAKQSKTRVARIEKCLDRIFAGIGPNEYIK